MSGDGEGSEMVDGDVDDGSLWERRRQNWIASRLSRGIAHLAFDAVADPQSREYFRADPGLIPFQHLRSAGGAEVTRRIRVICIHYPQPGHERQAYASTIVAEQANGTAGRHSGTGAERGIIEDQNNDSVVERSVLRYDELKVSVILAVTPAESSRNPSGNVEQEPS